MAACYNCGSIELATLYQAPAFDVSPGQTVVQLGLARCKACSMICTTGANDEAVSDAYSGEYYGSPSRKFTAVIERMLAALKHVQARRILRAWRSNEQGQRLPTVLDIGCGRGQLLRALQSSGASVLGLERREYPGADQGADFIQVGAIDDPAFAGRQFDIIILWHVLEHLTKQENLLDCITDHLRENGLLIVAVPNFASLQQRVFGQSWFHLDLPRHLVHLESAWLEGALRQRGYTLESVSHMDGLQNTYGFIQSALNSLAPQRSNEFYRLLKHGTALKIRNLPAVLMWSLPALLLLPFALLENLLGAMTRRGATVQVTARRVGGP